MNKDHKDCFAKSAVFLKKSKKIFRNVKSEEQFLKVGFD